MAGLADEDALDDQKKGPVVFQEQKSFLGEWSLINVYDNQEHKRVTFEVYGCDTSEILRAQYNYVEFDAFFRFNAELMNPNRREGRYHWTIERLEVMADGAGGRKLGLASEPTPEIPELPYYEKRKIPTGRMNYQERQRLRESMDQLDIKRNEAISKKRAEAKARFLVKMAEQKDAYKERIEARSSKIAREREERWVQKEQERREEIEAFMEKEALREAREENVAVKEENTEEADAQEIRNIIARYKEKEAIRQQEIKEARAARQQRRVSTENEEKETKNRLRETDASREEAWRQREIRVQKKRDAWLQDLLNIRDKITRSENLKAEQKKVFIKDLHVERQKVFTEQNARSTIRRKTIEETRLHAEEEPPPTQSAEEEVETKEGKEPAKPAAKGKKASPAKGERKKSPAPKKEKDQVESVIIDGVEGRMRAEMEKQRQLAALEKIREAKIEAKLKARTLKEAERAKVLRNEKRQAEEKDRAAKDQKAVIVAQAREEKKNEIERRKNDQERRENLRNENIQKKLLARLTTAGCARELATASSADEPVRFVEEAEPIAA